MAITPPNYRKDAIPTEKGWVHPKTSELLKSQKISKSQIQEYLNPTPSVEEPEEVVVDKLEEMTKDELEEVAREYGVELDKRRAKSKLIDSVKSLIKR